jgi:CBS domain-containing membrane protein
MIGLHHVNPGMKIADSFVGMPRRFLMTKEQGKTQHSELLVSHLMSSDPIAVQPSDPMSLVKQLMDENKIRHIPVVDDDGEILGLITRRDLLLRQGLSATDELPYASEMDALEEIRVDEIYIREPETVSEDTPIEEAARILLENKFGCLPVVEGSVLVGILTESDFVRYLRGPMDASFAHEAAHRMHN